MRGGCSDDCNMAKWLLPGKLERTTVSTLKYTGRRKVEPKVKIRAAVINWK